MALAVGCGLLSWLAGAQALAYSRAPAPESAAAWSSACTNFSQAAGGGCNWQCAATGSGAALACSWCTTPPAGSGVSAVCVGGLGNASDAPTPVGAPGVCSLPARAATCSECQYGAADPAAVMAACALAASSVSLLVSIACADCCGACCNSACSGCCNKCCCGVCALMSCGLGVLACASCAGAWVVFSGHACSGGCRCCGCECLPPVEEPEADYTLIEKR